MISVERYHDISCGHRVVGHEGKCRFFHGHNYRFHFKITSDDLDSVGRVIDFSVIKTKLCSWLEEQYDHKFLMWEEDPLVKEFFMLSAESIKIVTFNPTAENIAKDIVENIAPKELAGTGCKLIECKIEETRKCSAIYSL